MEQQHRVRLMVAGAALGGAALGGLFAGPGLAGAVQAEDDTSTATPATTGADGEVAAEGCGPRGPGGHRERNRFSTHGPRFVSQPSTRAGQRR